jgi:hypothetical protein
MQVIGQNHHSVDMERVSSLHLFHNGSQVIDVMHQEGAFAFG